MTDTIQIIRAKPEDALDITELSRKTFIETYYEASNTNQIQVLKYIDAYLTLDVIKSELQDPQNLFYVAKKGIQSVGFLKLNGQHQPKGIPDKKCLRITKLYVLNEFHGLHIGKQFVDLSKDLAAKEQYQVLWLEVWQHNAKAIQFYQHAGFVVYETCMFDYFEEPEPDFLMRYDLYN